jgi:general secretion pathway protein D
MKKLLTVFLLFPVFLFCQTIREKKESLLKTGSGLEEATSPQLRVVNEEIEVKRGELHDLYETARGYYLEGADETAYKALVTSITRCKKELAEIETLWRKEAAKPESYALWHQPDSTVSQLVADYGSHSFAYLIPPEIATVGISINSNLPIPRESWQECLSANSIPISASFISTMSKLPV